MTTTAYYQLHYVLSYGYFENKHIFYKIRPTSLKFTIYDNFSPQLNAPQEEAQDTYILYTGSPTGC